MSQDFLGDDFIQTFYDQIFEGSEDIDSIEIFLNPDISQTVNQRMKTFITKNLITKDTQALREWRKTVPQKLKCLKNDEKSSHEEFQE